jgi:hypothetical protein
VLVVIIVAIKQHRPIHPSNQTMLR